VKIYYFLVGIVVFLSISLVITPPAVSIPRESGITSRRRIESTFSPPTPAIIAA
jgi:hypothetical protein